MNLWKQQILYRKTAHSLSTVHHHHHLFVHKNAA